MRRALLAVVLVMAALASGTVASAASLTLMGGSLSSLTPGHPCLGAGPVAVVPASSAAGVNTYTAVQATLVPGCDGATVKLALTSATGTVAQFQGTVVGTSVTAPITSAASYVAASGYGVRAVVSGWGLPATWQWATPATGTPIAAGSGNTTLLSVTYPTLAGGSRMCAQVDVRPTTTGTWALTLDLRERPFNNAPASALELPGWLKVVAGATNGVVQLEGNGANATRRESFTICATTPAPAYDPALTYGVTQGPVSGTSAQACVTATVSVTGTPTFYAGWRADVDLRAAIALASTAPDTFTGVAATGGLYTVTPQGGGIYRVSGAETSTYGVRDGSPQTVTLCAS